MPVGYQVELQTLFPLLAPVGYAAARMWASLY